MTEGSLAPIGVLLLVACLIAMLSRRLGLPYIVGLVAAGLLDRAAPGQPRRAARPSLIFNVLLPPLVFEAALQLDWRRFRDELPLTLTLAFAGVAIAGAVVAVGMHAIVGWSWIGAALFGVLIAATDPSRSSRRSARWAPAGGCRWWSRRRACSTTASPRSASRSFPLSRPARTLGPKHRPRFPVDARRRPRDRAWRQRLILLVAGRTDDPLVEITLTTIAAYGSFLLAEHFHASGIISTLAAGLMIGSTGARFLSHVGRDRLRWAWEYFAFLANSFVFILIGMNEGDQPLWAVGSFGAGVAILLVLAGRALSVYPLAALFGGTRWRLPASYQHTLFWGGLRGALALALALMVPPTVPERSAIILTAFVVVAFSILVQGLTMPRLIRRFGLARPRARKPVAADAVRP